MSNYIFFNIKSLKIKILYNLKIKIHVITCTPQIKLIINKFVIEKNENLVNLIEQMISEQYNYS